MGERGIAVDHSTLNRWVVKYSPELEKEFRKKKLPVGSSWRVDETYVKVKGKWKYLYRAVDKINIDKSGANKAAVDAVNRDLKGKGLPEIELRQVKYLNSTFEGATEPDCLGESVFSIESIEELKGFLKQQ